VLPPLKKHYSRFYNFSHYVKDLVINVTPARLMTLMIIRSPCTWHY
jgi:hypothetical protein